MRHPSVKRQHDSLLESHIGSLQMYSLVYEKSANDFYSSPGVFTIFSVCI